MTANELTVAILTPLGLLKRGAATMVVAPSVTGELGVLADHRPLLADLKEGIVEVHAAGGIERYSISGGFLEVDRNTVTVLAESAERA